MKNFQTALLVFCLMQSLHVCLAQQPTPAQPPAASSTTSTETAKQTIRRTVAFIGVPYQDGLTQKVAIGTCFFVSITDKRLPEGQVFVYLITNRHVAQPGVDLNSPYPVSGVIVRLNLVKPNDGRQSIEELIPLNDRFRWYFPQDPAVDVAVLPIGLDKDMFDYVQIPSSLIVTAEMVKSGDVVVGDRVTFAGFFSNFPGQKRMEPIVREGVIAMMPDEALDTTLHKPGHMYLADLHAFHGNSGSPVFVNVAGSSHHGQFTIGEKYLLLGLISGYYPESEGFSVPAAMILTGEVRDNSGIAAIVPAEELIKLLNSTELQALRDKEISLMTKKP